MTKKPEEIIKDELEKILDLMQVKSNVEFLKQKDILVFKIIPKDEGDVKFLVGWHGQNLTALQNLLRIIVSKKLASAYQPFILDISDYRQKREEMLKNIAKTTAETVKVSGRSMTLDPMSSADRRIIHLAVTEFSEVMAESIGEGENRRIVIKPV